MKRLVAMFVIGVIAVGCGGDKATVTKKAEVSTPGGTTTTTEKVEVQKTGDNPPPAAKP